MSDGPLESRRIDRPAPPPGPYLVVGLGVAGLAAAEALADRVGPEAVAVWGDSLPEVFSDGFGALAARGVRLRVGDDPGDLAASVACVVKSPGVPDDAPALAAAAHAGVPVVDEAELGWRLDRRPLVGVTGTNGKSTVCNLVAAALVAAGRPAVVAGNTEGGPALCGALDTNAEVVVGELSSFQLRHVDALLPDVAVLTNCTHDSWHRHGGKAGYERDKARIALRGDGTAAAQAVLPADDPLGARLAPEVDAAGGAVTTFGAAADAGYRVVSCEWDLDGATVEVDAAGTALTLRTALPGAHNALNVAAALAAACASGVDLETAAAAIEAADPVPGRLERIAAGEVAFDVLVDYAHNPDGIHRTLATARSVLDRRETGRLVAVASALPVFDDDQYTAMARALAAGADRVVATVERLTADDPLEQPPAFFAALRSACADMAVELDRRTAVERAVAEARPGDVVLILGRGRRRTPIHVPGHEGALRVDDREQARLALEARAG